MNSSEDEEVRYEGTPSPTLPPSSSSMSSDSDDDEDDDGDDSGTVESRRGLNILQANRYSGFLRKPRAEKDATVGRRRQLRDYSDSDNSYERRVSTRGTPEGREYFDMEINADSTWGRQTLVENLQPVQVESLLAWAHSHHPKSDQDLWRTQLEWPAREVVQELRGQDNESIKQNPLLYLVNTPLPLSFLNYFAHRSTKIADFHEGLYAAFEDSALVAIGMMVEDIITASLLPLAGCHVLRCRQLEARPGKDELLLAPISEVTLSHPISNQTITFDPRNLPENETAFSAWTLPPEEAMNKLLSQGMVPDTGIPLLRAPVRSCGTKGDSEFKVLRKEEVVNRIFEEVGKSKTLLTENRELLDLFMVTKTIKRERTPGSNGGKALVQSHEPPDKRPRIGG